MVSQSVRRLVKRVTRRPSTALLVALCALVLSVTGNAAAAIIIGSNGQVAGDTISGHHPPAGKHANLIAGSVTDTDLAKLPAWHAVRKHGTGGTDFACEGNCWINSSAFPDLTTAAFYKWHGEVHLKGNVCFTGGLNSTTCNYTGSVSEDKVIFTLPPGFRPAHTPIFRAASKSDGTGDATVYVQASTGDVVVRGFSAGGVDLDGISFRIDN